MIAWWAWMLAGVGVTALLGLAFFLATESEFRSAFVQVFGGMVAFPAILLGALITRWMPRTMRLSPEALALFARQETGSRQSAWLFGYRGRGVIVVRRTKDSGWLNDVPNRATRSKRDIERRRERVIAEVRDEDGLS